MKSSNVILEAHNLSFHYQTGVPVLSNISFKVNEGEILGIIGPNGGGKSTLLKIIIGLLKPHSGHLHVSSEDKQCFSYVPQTENVNRILPYTVKEIVEFGLINRHHKETISVDEALQLVGLEKKADRLLKNLSGGETQRVFLAKALISNPHILVLDEPTSGLDSSGQDQLLRYIKKVNAEKKTTILIVDHNINQVLKHCDQVLCLNKTHHWHDTKDLLTPSILESIYHCEFEHTIIHENLGGEDHHFCDKDHRHGEDS